MKHIYEQPQLNKIEYAVSDVISTSGDDPALFNARDNEATIKWTV